MVFKNSHGSKKSYKQMLNSVAVVSAMLIVTASAVWPYNTAKATAFQDPGARAAGTGGSGGLIAVDNPIDGGEVTVGSTAQVVVKFRNDSSKDVSIANVNLYPSSTVSSTITLNECSAEPLVAGAECAMVVSVKGLQSGTWRVEMLVRHDGRSRIVTASLSGNVATADGSSEEKLVSDVQAIPDEVDFETLNSSRPLVKSVVLRNTTSESLEITNVSIQAAEQSGYSLSTDCEKLLPGQACIATITWAPTTRGKSDSVLLVEHSGSARVTSVDIKGEFDPDESVVAPVFPDVVPGKGLLVSSQEELDFGAAVSDVASIAVSLVNIGDAPITLSDIRLGGTENGLVISKSGCKSGLTLEPIEACPLTLRWLPPKTGSLVDDVQVIHDGARGVLVLPVRGTATGAVNKDTQAVVVKDGVEVNTVDTSRALEGFVITSHAGRKAIINGPGGSRVVHDGRPVSIGGVAWDITITPAGIDFKNGKDVIKLLFDRSLSSVNRTSAQSAGGSASSSSSASAGSSE